ncbi:hypothetical protein F0562_014972 [Nyssa sinensis]|uniref:Peptidase A1 domain-containing protein n=1 Tax=Nyssa sinensis TaxID=561372 RepID=A0A5J4ZSJ9_9ASTE|nr:hypothetical protein F0562_014972 [Nyssa sinensis]
MMEAKATAILFAFIFFSFSTGFTEEYQTLFLHSLPKPQTLHHLDALSLNATPESLFSLRFQRDAVRVKSNVLNNNDFSSTVISGLSFGSGDYFMRLGIGTPPKYAYMVLDTGSDVTWIRCLPCWKCCKQTDPIFDPTKSTSFVGLKCWSPLCLQLVTGDCDSQQRCLYGVAYGDGSLTFGRTRVNNVPLGCGHDNEGLFTGGAGLLGLGRGKLSFPSQTDGLFGRSGGVIMDSGTVVIRLTQPAYIAFRDAFRAPDYQLFDKCFNVSGKMEVMVPNVVLHFGGVDLSSKASNYLVPVDEVFALRSREQGAVSQ